jgi:hypothetical protein
MPKVVVLHQPDSLTLPLRDGARLVLTPFRRTPRVALTLVGPGGGDRGGVLLSAERARLLASWLARLAHDVDGGRDRRPPRRVPGGTARPRRVS